VVASLVRAGAVVVVAAGNDAIDACTVSPAGARDSLTVGASTNSDQFATFSNHGICVDLLAPGASVPGAWMTSDSAVKLESGTSMAAPLVSGSAARYRSSNPDASPAQVRAAIVCSGTSNAVRDVTPATTDALLYNPPTGWMMAEGRTQCLVGSGAGQSAGGNEQ